MNKGFGLEEIISKYGCYLGLDWTTKHNIKSLKIENSQQTEKVKLEVIEPFGDVANEFVVIAVEKIGKIKYSKLE
ncbi:hypothetical protein [Flammeovirga sp. SubArs3]|uniref:hypothetical protein n=1 Tax=Flammeovirga sp. SubArs3 TaxID=2995316 RepID=UPI00248D0F0C|nr:hypothetical protein [Flammeovirga sp. SubArs3]